MTERLPVDDVLPALGAALAGRGAAVLTAEPGAGKTTRVPLALIDAPWASGRIVMLEPRRLAARAAAERMAETLGEPVGARIGYRIRGEAKVSAETRVEVVTEGVLTRRLLDDPSLDGVAAVIFDEFHERSLQADLGLALCLESREALRPDLRLLVMSATLDAGAVAELLGGAPILSASGRAFPVETRWAARALGPGADIASAAAEAARAALSETDGDVLVFLPGAREIARAEAALRGLPEGVAARPLHGAMRFDRQRAALAPCPPGARKIVLATAIAETSLTVSGVRAVIDAGRARRARFDPGSGMTRLVTERATRAEADQRRGRAGRVAPGLCLRLWTKGEEGAMAPFPPPEIAAADLTGLALDLALWGARDAGGLAFLDPPPEAAFAEARALLAALGALDADGAPTALGRRMGASPVHPRLARMALGASAADAPTARALAGLLEERDPLRGVRRAADLSERLEAFADPRAYARARGVEPDRAALARARETARRLGPSGRIEPAAAGRLLALAYPDRVAQRRPGEAPRYLLSGGKGARLDASDALAEAPLLVAAELDGDPREALIRLAAPLTASELETLFADAIREDRRIAWSRRARRVEARRERRLGALTLASAPLDDAAPEALAAAMAEGVRDLGLSALPWTPAAARLRARAAFARGAGLADAPDLSDDALLATLDAWLTPHLAGMRAAEDLAGLDLSRILDAAIGWDARRALDAAAPERFETPAGSAAPIDYAGGAPRVSVPAQALYGLDRHPAAAGRALTIELLSPARRPIATTADLPGFWRGAWAEVRKEMRGRYPKHDWPEDPATAAPSAGARRRR